MANTDSTEITNNALPGLRSAKALVVEDETILFLSFEDELKDLGFGSIVHARDVDEALLAIERDRPDLAILDVNLDGDRVFPVARKLAEAKVPFFFVTGYLPESIPEEWAQTVVLPKPIPPSRLRSAVTAALKLTQ
jgi:DNA-binding response OmpR family regulator